MKISVIVAHPSGRSFNQAIARQAVSVLTRNGHRIFCHDLYAEKFDPVLPLSEIPGKSVNNRTIRKYCKEIQDSDGIIVIHPDWWGQPPAILKGWIDRVLRAGVAYEFEEGDQGDGIPKGLLKARGALIYNTSNTPARRERRVFGDPLDNLWKACIMDFCGVKKTVRRMFGVIVTSTLAKRRNWLKIVEEDIDRHFPRVR